MNKSKETKEKISKTMQKLWKSKEYRDKIIKKQIANGYRNYVSRTVSELNQNGEAGRT